MVNIVYFQLFSSPQEENMNHEKSLPILCPPHPFTLGNPFIYILDLWVQLSSVAQSCPTPCNPMNCSTPGLPVHHQLPESAQTHVH